MSSIMGLSSAHDDLAALGIVRELVGLPESRKPLMRRAQIVRGDHGVHRREGRRWAQNRQQQFLATPAVLRLYLQRT